MPADRELIVYVIIVGSGRLGSGLARVLSSEGNDVAVVDLPLDNRRLGPSFDGIVIEGNPIDADALENAGIRKADFFIAATADDNVNAAAIQMAKGVYNVPIAIARISDPEKEDFYRKLGFDTVCPTTSGMNQILDYVRDRTFSSLQATIDPSTICVLPRQEWIGNRLRTIRMPHGRKIVALVRQGKIHGYEEGISVRSDDSIVLARVGKE